MTELKRCECCGEYVAEHRSIAAARESADKLPNESGFYHGVPLEEFSREQLIKIMAYIIRLGRTGPGWRPYAGVSCDE